MDILQLFFKVNSTQVTQATQQVNQLGQAAKATSGLTSQIGSSFGNLTGTGSMVADIVKTIEDLGKALGAVSLTAVGAGAMLGVVAGAMGIVAGMSFAGPLDDISDLATKLGLSASQAALLKQQLESAGTTTEAYYRSLQKTAAFLQEVSDGSEAAQRAAKALGIDITANNDPLKTAQDLAEKYGKQMKEGSLSVSEMSALQQALGKDWREAVVAQTEAATAFQRANSFFEAGIGITKEGTDAASDLEKAQNDLNFIFKAVGSQLVSVVVPAFSTLITAMVDSYKSGGTVKGIFEGVTFAANVLMVPIRMLVDLFIVLDLAVTSVGKSLGAVFAAIATRSTDPLKALKDDLGKLLDDASTKLGANAWWSKGGNTIEAPAKQSFTSDVTTKGGKGDKTKEVRDPYTDALLAEQKAILGLVGTYRELNGMEGETHESQMRAAIDSDKKLAKLTEEQKLTLIGIAGARDKYEAMNKVAKAEKDAEDAVSKALQTSRDEIAVNRIRLGLRRDSTKTIADERVEIAKYNVQQAQEALDSARAANATEVKLVKLREELAIRKAMLNTATTVKKDTEEDAAKDPSTFGDGWTEAFKRYKEGALDAKKNGMDVFNKTQGLMEDGLTNFLETGKLGFKEFLTGFLKMIEGILVKWAVLNALSLAMGGGPVPLSAMFPTKQEDGGAWSGGTQFFANGDVFDKPTAFGMAGGKMGVMGEAGPEAIMPLTRGPNGKLGVAAQGISPTSIQVNTPVNIVMNGDAGNASDRAALAKQVHDAATAAANKAIRDAQRSGGMLSPNK